MVCHCKFLDSNQGINVDVYCLDKMPVQSCQMWLAFVNRRDLILLHDNIRPHVAKMTLQMLTDSGYETWPQPSYFGVSPTSCHSFSSNRTLFTPKIFHSKGELENTFRYFLASKPLEFYRKYIDNLVNRYYYRNALIFWLIKTLNSLIKK